MTFFPYPPKRDSLLYVARHGAVTLTCDAPSKALRPGISVSRVEPSGDLFSWYSPSSSRSLGHSLLLGQRSRLNFFSDLVRFLFHNHPRAPHTQFMGHRHDGNPRTEMTRMFFRYGSKELQQLAILADRIPSMLNGFAAEFWTPREGNRAASGPHSGGALGGHQSQKGRQLTNVFDLAPVPDTGKHLAGHDPADPGKRFEIVYTLRQFRVVLTKAANLTGDLKDLFLSKLQIVQQLIELKAHHRRAGKLSQLGFDQKRPLAAGGSRGKLQPFHQQQRFDALLHRHHLTDQGVTQLSQVAQLAVQSRGNMNALELAPTQILCQSQAVEPIGLHSLSWRFRNHRWRGYQARVLLSDQPVIQSIARRSSLIGKGYFLIAIVLANMVHKMIDTVGHAHRLQQSLMIGKSDRDTFLVHIESGKHVVIASDERLASHRSASLVQRLIDFSHCTLMEHSRYSSTSLIQVSGRTDKYSISNNTTPFLVSLVEP